MKVKKKIVSIDIDMEKKSELQSEGFVGFNENSKSAMIKMDGLACPRCRSDCDENFFSSQPHIQDLCLADREKIAQLVAKLAECTQARHKAEAELAEIRAENVTLINRYDKCCDEHEKEKNLLKQQIASAVAHAKSLKIDSSRSLDILSDQLAVQEKEFVKLTETVRDLVREKVQLQNALIEKDSRVKIIEAKLERSKNTLEMEKLLFLKEHVKDPVVRHVQHRASQTYDDNQVTETRSVKKNCPKTKSMSDLEEPSRELNLLQTLFFQSSNPIDVDL